jgi:hypothetical protein
VDSHVPRRRVGDNDAQLVSWHWLGDDESIHQIGTSIIETTIMSIVKAAIAGLPNSNWKIRELCGCREGPIGDGGLYAHIVTPISDSNTAA